MKKKNIAICAYGKVGKILSKFICSLDNSKDIKFVCTLSRDVHQKDISSFYSCNNIEVNSDLSVNTNLFRKKMIENKIDLVFLLWWPTIVKKDSIDLAKIGFVNLHPSMLPYNRGMHPYYWSIVEDTPAGVSIHFINSKIDEGEIIYQRKIEKDITMTGQSLYNEAEREIINLFVENYENIINTDYNLKKQNIEEGTFHLKKELDKHSHIELEKYYKAIDLINIMRGRSFKSGPSSFFYHEGKKYNINISIVPEEK